MKNDYKVDIDTTVIYCQTSKGVVHEVLIDTVDLGYINSITDNYWRVVDHNSTPYAVCNSNNKLYYMHRMILGMYGDTIVDHIDRDGLNNARDNLRVISRRGNAWNSGRLSSTGERCIQLAPNGRFRVRIGIGSRQVKQIGTFDTLEEAIVARDLFLMEETL